MTVAKILQWPLSQVASLMKVREKKLRGVALAKDTAHQIAQAGKLRVVEVDDKPPLGVHAKLKVYAKLKTIVTIKEDPSWCSVEWKEFSWWINIRPRHFPASLQGPISRVPKPHEIHYIEFWYSEQTNGRHSTDPGMYLSIKSWR